MILSHPQELEPLCVTQILKEEWAVQDNLKWSLISLKFSRNSWFRKIHNFQVAFGLRTYYLSQISTYTSHKEDIKSFASLHFHIFDKNARRQKRFQL